MSHPPVGRVTVGAVEGGNKRPDNPADIKHGLNV